MKKLIGLSATLALPLALTACPGDDAGTTVADTGNDTANDTEATGGSADETATGGTPEGCVGLDGPRMEVPATIDGDMRLTCDQVWVLTTITFSPGISNAEVSRRTGLAPQTASAIVTELEDDGLITRGDVLRGRRGQPATPLYLDYGGAYGIGCEISWRHIDITLINLGSEDLGRYRVLSPSDITAAAVAFLPADRRVELTVLPAKP